MSKTTWIIFIAIVALVFGGLIFYSQSQKNALNVDDVNAHSVLAASEQSGNIGDRVFGNAESKVVLVEYGDFQCPSCAGAHPTVKTVMEDYSDSVAFVFRNFPITSAHPHAKAAAAAAEAAGLQDKCWEMHDMLFERQMSWSSLSADERGTTFTNYAEEIGLNTEQFTSDLSKAEINQKINFDLALARKTGVTGTPTFFLNGERLEGEIASNIVQGVGTGLRTLLDQKLAE